MCELTEPAPGFVFSLTNAILGVIGTLILATLVWLYLRFADPPDRTFRGILFRIDPPNSYASRRRRVSQTTVQVIGVIEALFAGIAASVIVSCAFPHRLGAQTVAYARGEFAISSLRDAGGRASQCCALWPWRRIVLGDRSPLVHRCGVVRICCVGTPPHRRLAFWLRQELARHL